MKHYVLLVSVGPVQEFIASARRCRDLWYGSWLLSELSRAAALGMLDAMARASQGESGGSEAGLVFPGATSRASLQEPGTSVANRILLRIQGDPEQVRKIAECGKSDMLECLSSLRDSAFDRVGKGDPHRGEYFHLQRAITQVDGLIEYQWSAVQEDEGEGKDAYHLARREAERLLSARKNSQVWSQPTWAQAGVPKSSLDGIRESVLDEKLFAPAAKRKISGEKRRILYGVHGAERLCGVGLLKRHGVREEVAGRDRERFMSTSHLAALPFMLGVQSDVDSHAGVREALDSLQEALHNDVVRGEFRVSLGTPQAKLFGNLDGSILFEGRIASALKEHEVESRSAQSVSALRGLLSKAGRGEPIAYYAIILADGDRMGAVIDAQRSSEQHKKLSIALEEFAQDAGAVVRSCNGSLIYSGGDDVLALVPLHTALDCADQLARSFAGKLKNWQRLDGTRATLSAGIAIVHHLMPLDEALDVARQAEAIAKHDAGRNALALILHKRGGTPIHVSGKWESVLPKLKSLIDLRQSDEVSASAGYELSQLNRLGVGLSGAEKLAMREIQKTEARRVLGRKRAQRGAQDLAESTSASLQALAATAPIKLGNELVVASFLAQAIHQATGERSK